MGLSRVFFYHLLHHDDETIEGPSIFRTRISTANDVRAGKTAPGDHLIRQKYRKPENDYSTGLFLAQA